MFKLSRSVHSSGVVVLNLQGSLSVESVGRWEEALQKVKDEGRTRLVLDLTKLDYISSAGVGTFVACIAELRSKDGDIIFVNPSDEIREVFKLLGFTKMFRIMKEQKAAVNALAAT